MGAILAVGLGILIVSLQLEVKPQVNVESQPINLGGDMDLTRWGSNVTATTVSISATKLSTSTNQALAANSASIYRRLQNVGIPEITCQIRATTTQLVAGVGMVLTATGTAGGSNVYERYYGYWGEINCIAQGSTGTLSVIEY